MLLGAPGIATRSILATSNKKLLVAVRGRSGRKAVEPGRSGRFRIQGPLNLSMVWRFCKLLEAM